MWVGLRLTAGRSGIPALQSGMDRLEPGLARTLHTLDAVLSIRRMDIVHNEVQQAIRPQAVALAVFGGLAALAMLVLIGQGLAQLLSRSAAEMAVLRAVGATRGQAALAAGLEGAVAVIAGVALAIAGAYAVSPLAPVGPVHQYDPARGLSTRTGPCWPAAARCWARAARPAGGAGLAGGQPGRASASARPSALASAASAGLPVPAVIGVRQALERGSGQRPAAVRAALVGSVAAVTAVVMAAVFGASLDGLAHHPARYGWNWDLLIEAAGGYGNWKAPVMDKLVGGQPGVTAWSQFGFSQVAIDGQEIPVMGLQRERGSVEPPTTSGHPITGPGQIELGTATLNQIGKHIGDTVRVGTGRRRASSQSLGR